MTGNNESLEDLQRKIDQVKGTRANTSTPPEGQAMGKAMAYSTEMFAGIAVGGFAGYFLDRWLHTSPVLFILMFFLGAAAGLRNIMREVKKEDESK